MYLLLLLCYYVIVIIVIVIISFQPCFFPNFHLDLIPSPKERWDPSPHCTPHSPAPGAHLVPPPPQHATTASSPCALHGRKGPGAPQPPLLGQGMLGGEISYRADNFQLDWFYFLYQASQKQTDKTKDTKLMTHVFCQLTLSNSG